MTDEEGPNEAAQAFEELRAEVTLMRRAVERLTAERMEVDGRRCAALADRENLSYQWSRNELKIVAAKQS